VAILLQAENIVRIFGARPDLVELTSSFLRIAVASFIAIGFYGVLQQCISSTGDTLPPMLVTLLTMWLVQIPLALLLPGVTDLGVYGVRWAMVSGTIVGAIVYASYFHHGRWKRKRV
jgi:Na+-driven multidrug efflux pump